MTNVENIEAQIERLSPEEFAQLRAWVLERDWVEWDRQIETDGGKLEQLFEKAEADHRAGKSTEL